MSQAVLVIGEALIDIVRPLQGPDQEFPGGSPANVAITLARLGREARLLTWFAADERGQILADHLAESGVELVAGSRSAERTSTALAQLDETGAAQYEFDIDWRVPSVELPPDVSAVHLGSIAAVLEPGARGAVDIVERLRKRALVTYDPNMRPALMGAPQDVRPKVERLVELSDVVKVSDEDLAWLYAGADPVTIARSWQEKGPALVIITRGGEGATAISAREQIEIKTPKITVSDTVGAGDSFMGALLDHLDAAGLLDVSHRAALRSIDSEEITRLLTHAAKVAAITVSRPGANPPWREELAH